MYIYYFDVFLPFFAFPQCYFFNLKNFCLNRVLIVLPHDSF